MEIFSTNVPNCLAYSRIAPIQAVLPGNLITTGIETIDYFFSSEYMETRSSANQYSERVIKLTGMPHGITEIPKLSDTKNRKYFDIPEKSRVFGILYNLIKFHPDWDRILEINLSSQFVLARELSSKMIERGWGKIIFTASILSHQGGLFVPSYTASKGGIAQLTKALSNELADKGINVNSIAPGYVVTDITTALRQDKSRSADLMARIPMKRWGTIDDMAGAAVYLASDASEYVNGELLNVDGGWMGR